MLRFCPRKPHTAQQCAIYNINSKPVFDSSLLGNAAYEPDIFDMSTFPPEVGGLFTLMQDFFRAESECMNICLDIVKEEEDIRKDSVRSQGALDKLRHDIYEWFDDMIPFFDKKAVDGLKSNNNAYNCRMSYASETSFAMGEFHRHDVADMKGFILIELMTSEEDITLQEKVLWGDDTVTVKRIRYVIGHFDELLQASGLTKKSMGLYEYMFCKWAMPINGNIKKCVEYFNENYRGEHQTVKYTGVNRQSTKYDKNSSMVKNFHSNINSLINDSKNPELTTYTA